MDKQGRGGSLIATASVAGLRSGASDASYAASKAGVINLCRVVANQCTGTNIRCNSICPGIIETGMTKMIFDHVDRKGIRDKVGQINPLLRYGIPIEIAKVALFLASDDSSYVNGQTIPVDGGLSSSHPVARRGKGMST
ncbi:3-oxoacyl-acyl-carrier protein reductase [Hondaea fermentalgiana]|uniref:3-oxoacyl-acyl-carrier protein reductase n=1 Tax=Hondaea fermentalgiana TaxID=2315210 RepID=A0A2R5GB62_9STRA|nr:3-oxoacyl-acyl-carrier protein reductase [Hondaea fermentalgiana]|eukprot:GBG25361.1 3-oxoacyl-acyl-carrier protein reductase [Hondaea fermentalgiana]